jgi:hypothetical protein
MIQIWFIIREIAPKSSNVFENIGNDVARFNNSPVLTNCSGDTKNRFSNYSCQEEFLGT